MYSCKNQIYSYYFYQFAYHSLVNGMKVGGLFCFDDIHVGQRVLTHFYNKVTDYVSGGWYDVIEIDRDNLLFKLSDGFMYDEHGFLVGDSKCYEFDIFGAVAYFKDI